MEYQSAEDAQSRSLKSQEEEGKEEEIKTRKRGTEEEEEYEDFDFGSLEESLVPSATSTEFTSRAHRPRGKRSIFNH